MTSVVPLLRVRRIFQVCWLSSRSGTSEESRQCSLVTLMALRLPFQFWKWRPMQKTVKRNMTVRNATVIFGMASVSPKAQRMTIFKRKTSLWVCIMNKFLLPWKPLLEYPGPAAVAQWGVHGDHGIHRAVVASMSTAPKRLRRAEVHFHSSELTDQGHQKGLGWQAQNFAFLWFFGGGEGVGLVLCELLICHEIL